MKFNESKAVTVIGYRQVPWVKSPVISLYDPAWHAFKLEIISYNHTLFNKF